MKQLTLEVRNQGNKTPMSKASSDAILMMTPPVGEDYWLFRVKLNEEQSIIGFPKFLTIGIGFAKEENWNTNLPYTCETMDIWNHIKCNKGNEDIADEDCIEAIRIVQEAAVQARAK